MSSFNPFHGKLAIREGSSFAKTGIIKPLHEKSGPDNFRSLKKKDNLKDSNLEIEKLSSVSQRFLSKVNVVS